MITTDADGPSNYFCEKRERTSGREKEKERGEEDERVDYRFPEEYRTYIDCRKLHVTRQIVRSRECTMRRLRARREKQQVREKEREGVRCNTRIGNICKRNANVDGSR